MQVIEGIRYPDDWTGIWHSSRTGLEFTISPEIFGDVPEKIEDISTSGIISTKLLNLYKVKLG